MNGQWTGGSEPEGASGAGGAGGRVAPPTDMPRASSAGPRVPERLVPSVEQPAHRPHAPVWRSLVVFVLVVALIVAAGWLTVLANARWGAVPEAETAIAGVEALVRGDPDTLASISTPQFAARLTPAFRASLERGRVTGVVFSAPVWKGPLAVVQMVAGSRTGSITVEPDPSGAEGLVAFETAGTIERGMGDVLLQRDWNGWVIYDLALRPASSASTASPSGVPSSPSVPATP